MDRVVRAGVVFGGHSKGLARFARCRKINSRGECSLTVFTHFGLQSAAAYGFDQPVMLNLFQHPFQPTNRHVCG